MRRRAHVHRPSLVLGARAAVRRGAGGGEQVGGERLRDLRARLGRAAAAAPRRPRRAQRLRVRGARGRGAGRADAAAAGARGPRRHPARRLGQAEAWAVRPFSRAPVYFSSGPPYKANREDMKMTLPSCMARQAGRARAGADGGVRRERGHHGAARGWASVRGGWLSPGRHCHSVLALTVTP
jgi:hypothetical protein